MVEIVIALGAGVIIGFVLGGSVADSPHKKINQGLQDEIDFLRGVVGRREDHAQRIERVKHGLTEISSHYNDDDDPIPQDFLDVLDLFPRSMSKTLSWARKLRRQHVPWEKILQLYKNSIEENKPGFFQMKALRDAQRREKTVSDE